MGQHKLEVKNTDTNPAARRKDEGYAEYKARLTAASFGLKVKLTPSVFWDSRNKGTYIKGKEEAKARAKSDLH